MNFSSNVIPFVKATVKQSFIGVWFHDNNLSFDEQEKMRFYFERIFYYYHIFVNKEEFMTYIARERLVVKIFLIISDIKLHLSLLKLTQRNLDLFEKIYVFLPTEDHIASLNACFTTSNRRRLFEELNKDILKYIIKENPSCIAATNRTFREIHPTSTSQSDRIPPSTSVLNLKHQPNMPIRHMTKESLKFLYFLTMIDILLRIVHDSEDISEMWTASRNLYQGNNTQLDHIDKLAKLYRKEKAVQYYTQPTCLSRIVNQACHSEDMQWIFTFRVYISDLHWQLDTLNSQRVQNNLDIPSRIVFRGKPLSRSVLQQLIDNVGGLILFNGFLSTTFDPDVAFAFAGETETNKESRPVLFQLYIKNEIKQPFADISRCGTHTDESEILISLGAVWRIESITLDKNPCIIELTSCDELNSNITNLFENYTQEKCTLRSLGDILCELGEDVEAEWFYRKMLEKDDLDDKIRGILYYKIGMIRFDKEDYSVALDNFEKTVQLMKPSNDEVNEAAKTRPLYMNNIKPPLTTIHNNIGLLLQKIGKSDAAIECYQKALREKGSDFERAIVHNNLGILYFMCANYIEACEHHLKAVQLIDERHLYRAELRRNLDRAKNRLHHLMNKQKGKKTVD